jgi:serine/threonine protein kinase
MKRPTFIRKALLFFKKSRILFNSVLIRFGVLLYEMVTNTHLPIIFEQDTRFKKIHESVDDSAIKDIIIDCFRTDPNQRPTIRQCIDKLKLMKYKNL